MGILEKIKEIEHEMKITQKNKATSSHLGLLKARLCKLRRELLNPDGGKTSSGPGEGFAVAKSGDARVALIGFPSVGKSSLLAKLTNTKSEAAAYEFTTLTCIPGNSTYFCFRLTPAYADPIVFFFTFLEKHQITQIHTLTYSHVQ